MSNKSPIFPMPDPQIFSDYGFDPQFDYFQVLEEARKHKRENPTKSIDSLHFKLQKPISKDQPPKFKSTRKRWWKNALLFLRAKLRRSTAHNHHHQQQQKEQPPNSPQGHCHHHRVGGVQPIRTALSGPVYTTESTSGPSTPHRTTSGRPSSGPLTMTPSKKDNTTEMEINIPYINLRDLNMDQQPRISTASPVPIYLVT